MFTLLGDLDLGGFDDTLGLFTDTGTTNETETYDDTTTDTNVTDTATNETASSN